MDKPPFDPNQPFQPVEAPAVAPPAQLPAAKPEFDSSQPFTAAPTGPVPGGIEAALRGGAQGASLGFSDRVEGGANALFDKLTGNGGGKSLGDLYAQDRDEARAANAAAQKAHPYIYGGSDFAGGLASGLVTGGLGAESAAARIGMAGLQGGLAGVGYGHPENLSSGAGDALKGALVGTAMGTVGEGVGSILGGDAAASAKNTAENLAENATGGTAAEASRFRNKIVNPATGKVTQTSAGRELLDRGHVGAFDSQADIAQKVAAATQKSGEGIEDSLGALDASGNAAPIQKVDILKYIQDKIDAMKGRGAAGKADRSQLESIRDTIKAEDPDTYTLSAAENMKRDWDSQINYKNPKSVNDATKATADAYREAVENQATKIDPGLADQFTQNKEDWGLLKPILEAAQRRAEVTKQSPPGGILDMASMAAGLASGNPAAAIAAPIARRAIASRVASTAAVGADKIGDILQKAPDMLGPWASQLSAAAARGPTSLASTNYILSQTNADYRQHMKKVFGGDQQ